jgi:competence protein ComGA
MENQSINVQIERLFEQAMAFEASDILFLPTNECYSVHFRKFQQLFDITTLSFELGERYIAYLKFQASLDIGDQRKPQSGAFTWSEEAQIACRISTLPSAFMRESLIVRLMYHHEAKPLESLAFNDEATTILHSLTKARQGLVLMTGPTGSGKSTTLYSLVQQCALAERKQVISLEDPVEHPQKHLLQVQVNERAGVTYEVGLKAILRHSPDVIMIGEIRERATAKIAIEAALTGHLVFSTIHAKDSVGCIYRLLDLGISREDLRQTLLAIIAQRLVPVKQSQHIAVKALFEILQTPQISDILADPSRYYELPQAQTLTHQYEKGVQDGAIVDATSLQRYTCEVAMQQAAEA